MCDDKFMSMAELEMQRALKEGKLSNLKSSGKKLNYAPDIWTPEGSRVQYQLYKSLGLLPPEVQAKIDIENMKLKLKENSSLSDEEVREIKKKIALAEVVLNIKLENMKKE